MTAPPRALVELLAFAIRRAPTEHLRWRLVPAALRWAKRVLPSERSAIVRTRDGFRLRVRLGEWFGRHLYVTGEYEPATAALIRARLSYGKTFVDVGANAGYFTVLASHCVGPTGRVFAFEPEPSVYSDLAANIALNRCQNISVFREALSDTAGTATFYVGPKDHRGVSSLRKYEDHSSSITVRTARMDTILHGSGRIDLIKIDVEGAEYLALSGMTSVLERDRPDLIVEVTDCYLQRLGHSAAMLEELTAQYGYKMYLIGDKGLRSITLAECDLPMQYNALFSVSDIS